MSKGAVGLTAGYWPENVYRYLAIPGMSLDEGLITRPGRRRANHPALIAGETVVTYGELLNNVDQIMKGLLSLSDGKPARLAVALEQSLEAVKIIFGALKARWIVFIADPSLPAQDVASRCQRFASDLVITDSSEVQQSLQSQLDGTRVIRSQELEGKESKLSPPKGRQDFQAPAVALAMDDGHLVYHSHASLLAGAVSWSAFVALRAEDLMLALQPLHRWESLYSLMPILFRSGSCLLADLKDPEQAAHSIKKHRPKFTILPRLEARKLYQSENKPVVLAIREALHGLFVSVTDPFTVLGRIRLRNLLEKPALLTYGSQQAGPVLSSHPSWYLDAAVGMPLTNVDVWPLNPATGNPLQVPWETVEYGEVGIKSPMIGVAYENAAETQAHMHDGWLRSRIVATMDPNGLFYLQSKVAD
jgi:acyl-CoA synthetase (AMP-forming)/AMP-acid ligase II